MKLDAFKMSKNVQDLRDEQSLEDLLESATQALPTEEIDNSGKVLKDEPSGDIGSEMQNMRGYGKARSSKMWKVR